MTDAEQEPEDAERDAEGARERTAGRRAYDRMHLPELRRSLGVTQEELAGRLGTRQDSLSRTERRHDVKVSTLRAYIQALGGRLALFALFADRQPVEILGAEDLDRRK